MACAVCLVRSYPPSRRLRDRLPYLRCVNICLTADVRLHAWHCRSLPELQAYQQELRSQAVALAGHVRLGWINCGESGNDIICEEQMSRMAGHLNESEGEGEGEDKGDAAEHFDTKRLPALLMCGPSKSVSLLHLCNAEWNASLLRWAPQVPSRQLG